MITTTSSTLCYSYSMEQIRERAIMLSSYSQKMAAHAGDTIFLESVISKEDSLFIIEALEKGLCRLKEMFQLTGLSVETSCSDSGCSIELTIPDGRSFSLNDIDIIDTLSEHYLSQTILKEWATVMAATTLLTSSGAAIEALTVSLNEALMWLVVPLEKRSYSVTYLS